MSDVGIKQRKLRVTLETVTPMFLAGADKNVPELRAPSFIGALRYWTRAALGGVLGDKNLEALRIAEEEIWGSTQGKGAVRLKLTPPLSGWEPVNIHPLPHQLERGIQQNISFNGIPQGTKFTLSLTQLDSSKTTWNMVIAALFLFSSHGGIGRRTRRGFGTTIITKVDSTIKLNEADFINQLSKLASQNLMRRGDWIYYREWAVEKAVKAAQQVVNNLDLKTGPVQGYPAFPTISHSNHELMSYRIDKKIHSSWLEAITYFGTQEHEFLKERSGSAHAFGFATKKGRWASPLWVRVLPIQVQGRTGYGLAFSILKSAVAEANYPLLEQFLDEQFNTIQVAQS